MSKLLEAGLVLKKKKSWQNVELLGIMRHDKNIGGLQPNGCNVCPSQGEQPAWIAPGDVCSLGPKEGFETAQFQHCRNESIWKDDYEPSHHVKACLTTAQRNDIWKSGHCHNMTTTRTTQ